MCADGLSRYGRRGLLRSPFAAPSGFIALGIYAQHQHSLVFSGHTLNHDGRSWSRLYLETNARVTDLDISWYQSHESEPVETGKTLESVPLPSPAVQVDAVSDG